jgi:predicted phosphohydrolase
MKNKDNILWVTDIHLDHIADRTVSMDEQPFLDSFISKLNEADATAVAITGDISNAQQICVHLEHLERKLSPKFEKIFFVLGNHDFYHGSIVTVIKEIKALCARLPRLVYLTDSSSPIQLTDKTAIVGHDGWYDGGYANWFAPGVVLMNDYYIIHEFMKCRTDKHKFDLMNQFANGCANKIRIHVAEAAKSFENVLFLTHVPPFRENAVYRGKISDNNWMPCFSSKRAGDALVEVAEAFPNVNFKSLCGHSHGRARFFRKSNLESLTGESDYGKPEVSIRLLTVE